LGATTTTVHPWYSLQFNQNCYWGIPFWLHDASFAPDGSKIYIATTGFKPSRGPGFIVTEPRAGLCDVAAAFPATPGLVNPLWVNYTGCDSLYSTAADTNTAYFGGHHRWMSNPRGCGNPGIGSVAAPGLAGLSPANGSVNFNPTRGRGLGATDMVVTPAGLWVASDNFEGSNQCGGVSGHAGICFLPYRIAPRSDYNGDGAADVAVWRPSNGTWYVRGQANRIYGQSGDVPVVESFTGDTKPELAVFRPSTGRWYVSGMTAVRFGEATDKPVAADYTGDGWAEYAVWRPGNGTWYVRGVTGVQFGARGDIPVPGDFTGDGRADYAVFRPSNGTWYFKGRAAVAFGQAGDRPVVADFTGDGVADIAVWRPSTGRWHVRGVINAQWGLSTDVPTAADFTGDGKADITVWRPSNGTWYVRNVNRIPWGAN
ncbi:MAG: VCBS repeat-containing protein, partial [Actinobacteria bacterium]|nr:VCBS repeat-containing protein [Actinomycetota bacterium]